MLAVLVVDCRLVPRWRVGLCSAFDSFVCCRNRIAESNWRVRLVRAGSHFRELFQEIVYRGGLDMDIEKAIILNLILDMVSGICVRNIYGVCIKYTHHI